MEFTLQQLKQMVHGIPHAEHWYEALDQLLPDYEINTPRRIAAFVAQCAHESGNFRFIKENLNYKAESLTAGVTYKFRIQARNSFGNSDYSEV